MNPELDELLDMLGAERVAALLGKFRAEIEAFDNPGCSGTDAKARAHRLISQAGMLGFHALSQAARDFEAAASGDPPPPRAALLGEAGKALALVATFTQRMTPAAAGVESR